jgi:hypothetical protein
VEPLQLGGLPFGFVLRSLQYRCKLFDLICVFLDVLDDSVEFVGAEGRNGFQDCNITCKIILALCMPKGTKTLLAAAITLLINPTPKPDHIYV